MSTTSLNAVKSKAPTPSLGEVLLPWFVNTLKGMFNGLVAILTFVFAPIWNSQDRLKHLTHFCLFAFMGVVFLWVFFWIGQRPVFTIQQIQLQGEEGRQLHHVNQALVKTQVLSHLNGNFFSVRLDQARKAFEELPWIRSASVRRVWPNGLSVTLEEQEPIGIWNTNDGPKLLNNHGELFTVNLAEADLDKGLVDFSGPTNSNKEAVELYQQLNDWFKPLNAKVESLALSSRYSWTTKLDNGMTFELGRDLDQKDRSQIKNRIDRFFRVWPEVSEKLPNKIDYIDLRYANGFAVRTSAKTDPSKKESSQADNKNETVALLSQLDGDVISSVINQSAEKKSKGDFKKSKLVDGRKGQ